MKKGSKLFSTISTLMKAAFFQLHHILEKQSIAEAGTEEKSTLVVVPESAVRK